MAVDDWLTVPSDNEDIDGIPIGENVTQTNSINNIIRSIMASVKAKFDSLPELGDYVPKAGGVFSGTQPKFEGRGAFLHHNNPDFISGRVFAVAEGGEDPSGLQNGDILLDYIP